MCKTISFLEVSGKKEDDDICLERRLINSSQCPAVEPNVFLK